MKAPQITLSWVITALVWITAVALYGVMPDRIATHWNTQGIANGYSGRLVGLILVPLILTVIQLLFMAIPHIDPLKGNIETFKKQFDGFILLITVFMAYIFGIIVSWNMGGIFSMNTMLAPAFGLLFYGIGSLLKGVKRNWFIGIRTPWTMSSDEVWDKTHEVGSTVFKVMGLLALFGMVYPRHMIALLLVPAVVGSIGIIVYSYVLFQNKK